MQRSTRRQSRTGRHPSATSVARLGVESLEDRAVPATLYGLTSANSLVIFDSATPQTIQRQVGVTGLAGGESLLNVDFRPANNLLYGVGSTGRLYQIDTGSGAATSIGGPFTPSLNSSVVGVNFNPVPDRLRIVTNAGQNLRVNPDTGVVTVDTPLAYDATNYDAFFGGTAPPPQIVGAAYTKNLDNTGKNTVTTLYGIDSNLDALVIQGSPDGDPLSPNGGQLFIVDQLGFDVTGQTGFDIEAGTDAAFAVNGNQLYTINISTGKATAAGTVAGGTNFVGLTVAPPALGPGILALSTTAPAFSSTRMPIGVTVNRTGGATGTVTVDYATADGTAIAGTDYLPTSGTLSFAPGQLSQTIFLLLPSGPPTGGTPAKSFTLTLTNPTGGAGLSAARATVSIPEVPAATAPPAPIVPPVPGVPPAPPPTSPPVATAIQSRFYAVGVGAGAGPVVIVYDAVTGAEAFRFFAFEQTFTGGVQVATGDVNGDGVDDIIVGSGVGGGPRIRVFDGRTRAAISDFFAYEDTFRGGVQVAAGDVNGDGFADIIAGSGVGGGPRIRIFDGLTNATIADYFAYEESFRGGVQVASGEFNGDGFNDVVAGSGFGGGPRVRIFSGATSNVLADYFAYADSVRGGVNVAAGDVNGDGRTDVVAGAGPGGGPDVRAFSGATTNAVAGFFAFDASFRGGTRVATTDLDADGTDEIVTVPGAGGGPLVRVFSVKTNTQRSAVAPIDLAFTGGLFVG